MSALPPSLARLLAALHALQASDLFLTEGAVPSVRLHGRVLPLDEPATTADEMAELLGSVLHDETRATFDRSGDADVGISLPDGSRYRINLLRQQGRSSAVARAVPSGAVDLAALRLPESVRTWAHRSRGLVLVTGATGSGKSTTLAALVHEVNRTRPVHIVTIEDPIEFVHVGLLARVTQREVGSDTRSFQTALRQVVRQSPDVILVGELRDAETIEVALAAAQTGHLVFATLHTIDASQTLQRILAYFPVHMRNQVASDLSMSLVGVLSQRLLPRADGEGRVVAAEVLTATPAVTKLLREQRVEELQDLMRAFRSPEVSSFNDALLRLLKEGQIGLEVALGASTQPDELSLMAKGMTTSTRSFRLDNADELGGLDMRALLRATVDAGASDLHLSVGRTPMLRVRGEMRVLGDRPLTDADLRILLFSILTSRQRSIYELERELDFAISLEDGRRFRVNAYFQKGHMAAALRAIPSRVPSAIELRLPESVVQLGGKAQGLLLVVGPTGSGKSTTLACLLDRINRTRACRIITVEDPIEYVHESHLATVDQREVYADTKSFAAALKYILRQDPDVILVGEMRDMETVSNAITAAETGHLVLATLHSNDAVQAIDRIVDVFPGHQQGQARSQIASALLAVVSQRLLPKKDGTGRVPAFEVMVATTAIRSLIRDDKMHTARSIMETARKDGMVTLDHALVDLYESNQISYEEALRYVTSPKLLRAPPSATEPEVPLPPPPAASSARPAAPPEKKFPWSR